MAEPTLDELVSFMKKHGVEKVDSITDEKSAIKHFRAASRVYKEERDSFRKQRDELIDDMQNMKRKAEAFDLISNSYTTEIEQAIKNKELNQCLFLLEQILDDLERGSDDNRN